MTLDALTLRRGLPLSSAVVIGCVLAATIEAFVLRHVSRKWEDALFTASAHPTVTPQSSML
jgi:hypothetical protein